MKILNFILALALGYLGGGATSSAALPSITSQLNSANGSVQNYLGFGIQPQFRDNFSITSANTHQSDPNLPVMRDPHRPDEPVGNFKDKNAAFAAKMGYNPAWMDDSRDYEWIYNDNIKYMTQEKGAASWWDPQYVNPYVSYRDLDVDKLMLGLKATEDGVYKGCNPNAIFHWYDATGVMPVNWALSGDQIVPDCNETYGVLRTKMVEDAFGTSYKGSQGEMDFTYGQIGSLGNPQHLWFAFGGRQYHGSGEGGWEIGSDARNGSPSVYLVLTNTTPYWTPDENSAVYNQPLVDNGSKNARDPRIGYQGFATWNNVNNWLQNYESWQKQNGTLRNPQPYTTRLKNSGVAINR